MPELAAPKMVRNQTDDQLFTRLKAGDQYALRVLFDRYFERLATAAQPIVLDPDIARDIAQQVFITLWQQRDQIQVETRLYGYLRKMAINAAVAHARKSSRRAGLLELRPLTESVQRDVEADYLHTELQQQLM
ncbi:MAG: sigma factor, partial [Saprospiraceae bacterium]|nr:sigma factor [Saprospiraceae bacterium]